MPNTSDQITAPLTAEQAARLDADLHAWHDCNDTTKLAYGYRTAGQDAALRDDIDAACFLYTQAYVFALRAGLQDVADALWSNLKAFGRED